ncbi:MAG TPA: benzoate/H(+) symporter BenE family transporter [Bacillota bacterium]|nr:benzoate/H(+) symporter BenE family transporter [Bacillota bacterium]
MELQSKTEVQDHAGHIQNVLFSSVTLQSVSTGLISATLIMTGPAVMLLEAAQRGGFSIQQSVSWMFAVYFFGGLYGILMSLWYRMPIAGGHSLTGIAFLSSVTSQFAYSQMIGGYVMSALLIIFIGTSGIFNQLIKWVPKEIISAMLAGLVASYVVRMVPAVREMPIVGGVALISYFVLAKFSRQIPPALGAIIVLLLMLWGTRGLGWEGHSSTFSFPTIQNPEFNWSVLVSLALPLALLILSNDVAVAVGALERTGYKPPIRTVVTGTGLFSLITAFFGGQCSNIAGMMTAICSSENTGSKEKRYVASLVSGMTIIIFGIFSWKVVPFVQALPQALISMLAGFALIGVLLSNLQSCFGEKAYPLSSLTTFIIALSNLSIYHISSAVWAILIGAGLARILGK